MEKPNISVVIPTFQRNNELVGAVRSAINQSIRPEEIIIVDGTGGGALPVLQNFHEEIIYIPVNPDPGQHRCREIGFLFSNGDYIQFLDDDDRLRDDKFEKQIPEFDDEIGVVYSSLKILDNKKVISPDQDDVDNVLESALLFDTYPCVPSTMLIKREIIKKIIPFRNTHNADDVGMKIELARRTSFNFVSEPLAYALGDTDYSLSQTTSHAKAKLNLINDYQEIYDDFPPEIKKQAYKKAKYQLLVQCAKSQLQDQYWSLDSIWKFWCATKINPSAITYGYFILSIFGRPGIMLGRIVMRIFRKLEI